MEAGRGRGLTGLRYRRTSRWARWELTRAAVSAVCAGVPVVPGAWWSATDRRFHCDLPGCHRTGPHPALLGESLATAAIRQPEVASARWREQPYAVLVPTGEACDVVDVPAALGMGLAAWLDARSSLGPVIAAGSRWFFLTAVGGQLSALGGDILVHGLGSWIMLPPSLGPGGEPAAWLVEPGISSGSTVSTGSTESMGSTEPAGSGRPDRIGWALPSRDDVIRGLSSPPVPAQRHSDGPGQSGRQVSRSPV